jgi:hypothetical protein
VAKLTRLTHKIAIRLHLVAESCTICSSRSRQPVRKLLDTPSQFLCQQVGENSFGSLFMSPLCIRRVKGLDGGDVPRILHISTRYRGMVAFVLQSYFHHRKILQDSFCNGRVRLRVGWKKNLTLLGVETCHLSRS